MEMDKKVEQSILDDFWQIFALKNQWVLGWSSGLENILVLHKNLTPCSYKLPTNSIGWMVTATYRAKLNIKGQVNLVKGGKTNQPLQLSLINILCEGLANQESKGIWRRICLYQLAEVVANQYRKGIWSRTCCHTFSGPSQVCLSLYHLSSLSKNHYMLEESKRYCWENITLLSTLCRVISFDRQTQILPNFVLIQHQTRA